MGKGTILVTGGGGFLGTWICRYLKQEGFRPISFSRSFYTHLADEGIEQIQGDICEIEPAAFPGEVTAVIHSAALAEMWGEENLFQKINVHGTQKIIDFCKQKRIQYLIFTSSPSVVFPNQDIKNADEKTPYASKPLNDYARTKAEAEKLVLAANSDSLYTVALRPHLIFGPGDNHLIPRLIEKAKQKKLVQVGDGENLVDVIYVENAAKAHIDALQACLKQPERVKGKAYFLGQEKPVRLWPFIEEILALKNLKLPQRKISFPLAYMIGFVCEKVFPLFKKEPPMTRFVACQLNYSHYFNHQKAMEDFSYKAFVSTQEGLKSLGKSL